MERMTHERVNGIKTGYWSAASKEEVVQRLAQYENTGLEPEEIMDLTKMGGVRRCRNCEHYHPERNSVEPCEKWSHVFVGPNDYCSMANN